jgi:hypothetical protein
MVKAAAAALARQPVKKSDSFIRAIVWAKAR